MVNSPPCSPRSKHAGALGSDERRERHATAEPFAERQDVRHHAFVLVRDERAGPTDPSLDFVEHQEHAVFVGDRAQRFQVAVRRHDDAALALNGFDPDTDGVRTDGARHGLGVAERHFREPGDF